MPRTRKATITAADLPDVCSPAEIAAFERVDIRIVRSALERGELSGSFRRGSRWRISRDQYLNSIGHSRPGDRVV